MTKSVSQVIQEISSDCAAISDSYYLDALVLISNHLQQPKEWLLSHLDAIIPQPIQKDLDTSINQYCAGRPLPYIIGRWEFFGFDFLINESVLIPRPETEQIVEEAMEWLRKNPSSNMVADVGTGSGCIGISIAKFIPSAQVLASDISLCALRVAQENAERLDVIDQTIFVQQNLLAARGIDILCANLPYIPTGNLELLKVVEHEPHIALDGGESGLNYITDLLEKTTGMLSRRALILLEIEESQATSVMELVKFLHPDGELSILKDISGKDRIVRIELV